MSDETEEKTEEKTEDKTPKRGHDFIQPDDSYMDSDSIFGGGGFQIIHGEQGDG